MRPVVPCQRRQQPQQQPPTANCHRHSLAEATRGCACFAPFGARRIGARALVWKFFKDGVIIAFYPVFGEIVFFYLLYQEMQNEPLPCEETALIEEHSDDAIVDSGEDNPKIDADDPTEAS